MYENIIYITILCIFGEKIKMARKRAKYSKQKYKNYGLFSNRQGSDKLIIYAALTIVGILLVISLWALAENVLNPGAWAMLVFFGYAMGLILLYEENVFPTLQGNKWISYAISWFCMFIAVPVVVSLITSFDIASLVLAMIFFVPGFLAILHILNEQYVRELKKKIKPKKRKLIRKFK